MPVSRKAVDVNIDGFGESIIRDTARINLAIYNLRNRNWWSKITEAVQTTYIPFAQEMLMVEAQTSGQDGEGKLDKNIRRKEYIAPGSEPKTLPKDTASFADNREEIKELIEEIRILNNQKTEVALATSGVAKRYDLENYSSSLQMYAEMIAFIENEEAYQKFDLLGVSPPNDFIIEYSKNFVIQDEMKTNEEYRSILNDPGMPESAKKIARYQLCLNILPLTGKDKEMLWDEINREPEVQSTDGSEQVNETVEVIE
jgi:hypothetical protein